MTAKKLLRVQTLLVDRRRILTLASAGLIGFVAESLRGESNPIRPFRTLQTPVDETLESTVVSGLALNPDATLLAVAGDNHRVHVWNLHSYQVVHQLAGHTDWVRAVAFSPDGSWLASAGNDRRILLWNTSEFSGRLTLGAHSGVLSALVFGNTKRWLAACGFECAVHLFDIAKAFRPTTLESPCRDSRSVAFSPDDKHLAVGGRNGRIRVWDPTSGAVQHEWSAHSRRVRCLAFSPDGAHLASCSEDRTVQVWSVGNWSRVTSLETPTSKNTTIAFVDTSRIACAGSDNQIRLWNSATQQVEGVLTGHTGTVATLVARNGILISAGYDTTIRLWQLV